jgi:hypothetical protein
MKKPVLSFDKGKRFKTIRSSKPGVEKGFFRTIPNPLKQLPAKIESYLRLLKRQFVLKT